MDNLEKHAVQLDGHLVTAEDVSRPKVRSLLEKLSGKQLPDDRLLAALRQLPPEHQRLVGRVLA
jgi:hypothetical protein